MCSCPALACGKSNTTYSYNAFVSGGCGTNSVTNSLATYQSGFVSTADPGNYALTIGQRPSGQGTPEQLPDGSPGPETPGRRTNDIGAYEYMGG